MVIVIEKRLNYESEGMNREMNKGREEVRDGERMGGGNECRKKEGGRGTDKHRV